ncbi:MAG: hypothetical protein HFE76_09815 [Firmicutes bacterium]|nr:hypothetical protein [Bacillota bacterium]
MEAQIEKMEQQEAQAKPSFAMIFFRIYDRKIASGELTFAQTGMKKEDFTMICTDKSFVPPAGEIRRLCEAMKLTGAEREQMLSFAAEDGEEV